MFGLFQPWNHQVLLHVSGIDFPLPANSYLRQSKLLQIHVEKSDIGQQDIGMHSETCIIGESENPLQHPITNILIADNS